MIIKEKGYSYNDLTIVPEIISKVKSRSECKIRDNENHLPIFTAPMASVISCNNRDVFENNGIYTIMPRNISIEQRIDKMVHGYWVALSLTEFEDLFVKNYQERTSEKPYHICVDIANGHMHSLYTLCKKAKELSYCNDYELIIMTGNIANPKTYGWICENCLAFNLHTNEYNCCIDYIRVGIGGGLGCITTSNTSAHYPQASLIEECYIIKNIIKHESAELGNPKYKLPYIVADGGIRNYDHVIKALALGADYVMIGSLFAQCIESCGLKFNSMYNSKHIPITNLLTRFSEFKYDAKNNCWYGYYNEDFKEKLLKSWTDGVKKIELSESFNENSKEYVEAVNKLNYRKTTIDEEKRIGEIFVKFFGMASADGQKSIMGKKVKTSEGITKMLQVKYTLSGWVENMESYLKSAMSYCDCFELSEFKGKPKLIPNSISEIYAVNK